MQIKFIRTIHIDLQQLSLHKKTVIADKPVLQIVFHKQKGVFNDINHNQRAQNQQHCFVVGLYLKQIANDLHIPLIHKILVHHSCH